MRTSRIGIPPGLRFDVLVRSNFCCGYCGRSRSVELEIDHIIPVARGGTNDINNLVAACRDCNRGKAASMIDAEVVKEKLKVRTFWDYADYESNINERVNNMLENHHIALALAAECSNRYGIAPFIPEMSEAMELA